MKSIITALAVLLLHLTTLSLAAPHAAMVEERVFLASLTFYGAGAGGEFFFQQFPADDQVHKISKTGFFSFSFYFQSSLSSFFQMFPLPIPLVYCPFAQHLHL